MNRTALLVVGVIAVGAAGWALLNRGGPEEGEIEYRYSAAERGTLSRSISATGQVVALTKVDVKSKAGGKIIQLAVDEGSVVKTGDLIALIDPSDTQSSYDQANADLESANARAVQAERNYELQRAQSQTAIAEARAALDQARIRLQRAEIQTGTQPSLSQASVRTAQSNYDAALASQERLQKVDILNQRKEVETSLANARTNLSNAEENLRRQQSLLQQGFVAKSAVDAAENTLANARRDFANAQQAQQTLEDSVSAQLKAARLEVDRTKAALDQARANMSQVDVSKTDLAEARKAVQSAEINLQTALNNRTQIEVRRSEVVAAKASTVRSRVALENAKVQLDSTTVVAPRSGVITQKYLEEGTIIPPGTSTFAQGTSLVEISDVTQLYVECAVDEADIGAVKVGQKVKIVTEAFPNEQFDGVVERVNPAALTENNITAVKVRVRVLPGAKVKVLPGMNATCEFVTLEKPDVIIVPSQAIKREEGKTFVLVKGADPKKPERREVEIGESGNDGVEILKGVEPGEEVVTAEINVSELLQIQEKMKAVEEGGGLTGGGGRRR